MSEREFGAGGAGRGNLDGNLAGGARNGRNLSANLSDKNTRNCGNLGKNLRMDAGCSQKIGDKFQNSSAAGCKNCDTAKSQEQMDATKSENFAKKESDKQTRGANFVAQKTAASSHTDTGLTAPKSPRQKPDHMTYLPGMEILDSDMLTRVQSIAREYDYDAFTDEDVMRALKSEHIGVRELMALLSPAAAPHLEEMARLAKRLRNAYFGDNVYFFTPLYIANFCDNHCVYCGFNCKNDIARMKLNEAQMRAEMASIAQSGLKEVLILTGESPEHSPVRYIGRACEIAREYFDVIGLEIYPVNSADYAYLHACGADFVTVFQETYNAAKYAKLHLAGNKRIFPYRFYAQERALRGGMRGVGFGALLGLDDFRRDALCTALHAHFIQRAYPHAEIALSVPRLRPIINNARINPRDVGERELLQVILAYRIFLPYASITISTRENAHFRDNAVLLAASKISAGVSVGIGTHAGGDEQGDEQFEISDPRTVAQVRGDIAKMGLNAVLKEYVYV